MEGLKYRFTKYSREHFSMYGIDRDKIPVEILFEGGMLSEWERRKFLSSKENLTNDKTRNNSSR